MNESFGPYQIRGSLGAGGMGEVHRAHDTRLDRDVAIKLLPLDLAQDPERLARLQREAKTLASLQHPNLATVFDFGQEGDRSYLVMELVEGEDLQQRLERGAIPVDEACDIALQIAQGLEAAHAGGIVHRDLKPGNIRLGAGGTVKILDFGLARAYAAEGADTSMSQSPTVSAAFTQVGTILGTAGYMSPEQARGQHVDARADVWAFGVVLTEMLTGRMTFRGDTISDTLASVLRADPPWDALPSETPPRLRRLLDRCLEREPARRLQAIGEARIVLEDVRSGEGAEPAAAAAVGKAGRPGPAWIVTLLAIAATAAGVWLLKPTPEIPTPPRVQSDLLAGENLGFDTGDLHLALSADGTQLAFAGLDTITAQRSLYVRNLASGEVRHLAGTEEAEVPFWSPQGTHIGFFVRNELCTVGLQDGIVERGLAKVGSFSRQAAWGPDDWITVVTMDGTGTIYRVRPTGGTPEIVHELPSDEAFEKLLSHPSFLPRGELIFSMDTMDGSGALGVYVLEDGATRMLVPGASNARWVEGGYLVYRREERVFARPFDAGSLEFRGQEFRIASPVRSMLFPNQALMSVARDGTLVYLPGAAVEERCELVWVDRQGKPLEDLGITGDLYTMHISQDGRRLAIDVSTTTTAGDIWVFDLARQSSQQLTDHPLDESWPVWGKDDEIVFFHRADILMRVDLGRAPKVTTLFDDGIARRGLDVHPSGSPLLITRGNSEGDIYLVDPDTAEETPWLELPGDQNRARFSPDGNWVVYESSEREGVHLWVERFPEGSERFRVTEDQGGRHPVWSRDGGEIFFTSPNRRLMAVAVDMEATDRRPVGEPRELFPVRLHRNLYFDVSADGERFLLNQLRGEVAAPSAVLVRGWQSDR